MTEKEKKFFYLSWEYFALTVLPFLLSFFEWPLSTDLFSRSSEANTTGNKRKEKGENNRYKSFVAWWYYQYDIAVVVVVVVVVVAYWTFYSIW